MRRRSVLLLVFLVLVISAVSVELVVAPPVWFICDASHEGWSLAGKYCCGGAWTSTACAKKTCADIQSAPGKADACGHIDAGGGNFIDCPCTGAYAVGYTCKDSLGNAVISVSGTCQTTSCGPTDDTCSQGITSKPPDSSYTAPVACIKYESGTCEPGFAYTGWACDVGYTLCGGQCVNTNSDPNNCGGCGSDNQIYDCEFQKNVMGCKDTTTVSIADGTCNNGICATTETPCLAGETCAGGVCTAPPDTCPGGCPLGECCNVGVCGVCTPATTFYPDNDGDTYGDPSVSIDSVLPIAGYVQNGDDCDDTTATVRPGFLENTVPGYCADAKDNDGIRPFNCKGETDFDGYTNGQINPLRHGDQNCPVSVTAISAPATGSVLGFPVTCTTPIGYVRSIQATNSLGVSVTNPLGECNFIQWTAGGPPYVAEFNCVSSSTGTATVTCGVDLTKSYQSGPSLTATTLVTADVTVTGISTITPVCGASGLPVNCTYDVPAAQLATLKQGAVQEDCSFKGWDGNTAMFTCNTGPPFTYGPATVTCSVDTTSGAMQVGPDMSLPVVIAADGEYCDGTKGVCLLGVCTYGVQWLGKVVDASSGQPVAGAVSVSVDGEYYDATDGVIDVTGIKVGSRTIGANASIGYDPTTLYNVKFMSDPTYQDITLTPYQCQSDCSFAGRCDFNCIGVNGCELPPGWTAAEVANVPLVCQGVIKGNTRLFNRTHAVNCCLGPFIDEAEFRTQLTLGGCTERMAQIKLPFFNIKTGKLQQLTVVSMQSCQTQ